VSSNGKIPKRARGRLVYIGRDDPDDVAGAIATIGAALHFAAENLEQFRSETNAHNLAHGDTRPDELPTLAQYRLAVAYSHDMVSPECTEPVG
jgi:hypothetical protein